MHNMLNNMQLEKKNSAGFIFCIFCILQYAEYAEYVKEYATVCKTICKICIVWDRFVHLSGVSRGFNEISTESQAAPELSSSLITDHRRDSSGWDDCSGASTLLSYSCSAIQAFYPILRSAGARANKCSALISSLDGPRFV